MAKHNILDSIRSSAERAGKKSSNKKRSLEQDGMPTVMSGLVADIKQKLDESERSRRLRETQWTRNVNSYRGKDSSTSDHFNNDGATTRGSFRGSEISKVYVRTTTVKVKAAYAQVIEALFSDSKFPISITDTRIPEGVSEFAHLKTDMEANVVSGEQAPAASLAPEGSIGFEGDGQELAPGSTQDNMEFLAGLKDEFTNEQGETVLVEGVSKEGAPQLSPSSELARRMEKVIHDQLEETQARTELRKMVFELCLLGTGVMKGPFNVDKTLHKWDENGVYSPEMVKTAKSNMVSVWNFYPDPNAETGGDMEWAIERHQMHAGQLRALKDRPHFRNKAIDRVLMQMGNWERRSFEHTIDEDNFTESENRLYEVLEFWGFMNKQMLEEFDIDTSTIIDDAAQVNVWTSGNEVLRVVVNPFIPQRIPYYVVPYETDPYTIWGTGVPESMEDTQALMNGFMRLAVDNLALSGNLVFDIDDSMLVPGQEMDIHPGKIFRRQTGGQGQAIHGISFPNTAPANMDMFRQVRQMADESTGIPSFAHGQMGVMSPTRTASGMSMLLNNASLNIKTVIRNIDDFLLKPWGEAYYRWHMQFNDRVDIKGDLEIRALGSSSMQAKEIRSNRLNTFLQLAANPALAPLIKFPTVIKELAISMDMDPNEILNNPEEQQIFAQLMGLQGMQQPQQGPAAPPPEPGLPVPGESGFTGNAEGAGNQLGVGGGGIEALLNEAQPIA